MDVKRYFTNRYIECKPLEGLIEKYESLGFDVAVNVDIDYKDASISVMKKKELQELLRSRGEPASFKTYILVRKDYGDAEHVTHYRFRFDTKENELEISSFDLSLINDAFEYAGQSFIYDVLNNAA